MKTHTYADGANNYNITVDLVDEDGTFLDQANPLAVAVDNIAPTIAISGAGSVDEGSPYSLTLGGVSDPGTDTVSSYTVHWGDGNSNTYSTAGAKTHTYADGANVYAVTVDLVDEDGTFLDRANALSVTVNNVAPTIAISGAPSVNEGSAYSLTLGGITDPGTDTVTSYTVHWGDGNSDTYSTAGVKTHTYADGPNTYNITVDLVDEDGTFLNRANALSVTVVNAAPAPTITAPASSPEASVLTLTANPNDPGVLDTFTYSWTATKDGNPFTFPGSVNTTSQTLSFTPVDYGTYVFDLTVTDNNGLSGTAQATVNVTFVTNRVVQFSPTASGFSARFIREVDMNTLNLWSGQNSAGLVPDVALTGPSGLVRGTIVYNPATFTVTFVATGGVLPAGSYNVLLRSGADNNLLLSNGFIDRRGGALDGNSDGTVGDNYTTSFSVAAPTGPVLTLPDFARGPGQLVNVPATNSSAGLPVSISGGMGATQVTFTLNYDPSTVLISSPTPALAGWTITSQSTTASSITLTLELTDTNAGAPIASNSSTTLVSFTASVPSVAEYGAASALAITDVTYATSSTSGSGTGDSAVHAAIYLADATGDKTYSALDASKIARIVVGLDSGFDGTGVWDDAQDQIDDPIDLHFLRIDPTIIGDATGDGTLSGLDAAFVAAKAVGIAQSEIPDLPPVGGFSAKNTRFSLESSSGVTVTIGSALTRPGGAISLPISVDLANGLQAADFTLSYDPSLVTINPNGVSLGSSLPAGWAYVTNVDNTNGILRVSLYNTVAITSGGSATLLNLAMTVNASAPDTTTSVNVVNAPQTASRLNEGQISFASNASVITIDAIAPFVSGVYVYSSSWSNSFKNFLASSGQGSATLGYLVNSTTDLPWTNLNTINIQFSENVAITGEEALALIGITTPDYSGTFSYNSTTHIATLTFSQPFVGDKLLLNISSTASRDIAGNDLNGGSTGSNFEKRVNILPGDFNNSQGVNTIDTAAARNAQGATAGGAGYSIFLDFDGSGGINTLDTAAARNRQGSTLPAGEPAPEFHFVASSQLPILRAEPEEVVAIGSFPIAVPIGPSTTIVPVATATILPVAPQTITAPTSTPVQVTAPVVTQTASQLKASEKASASVAKTTRSLVPPQKSARLAVAGEKWLAIVSIILANLK